VEAALCTLVGGAGSGAIKAKFPEIAGFDTRIPAAALLIGAGLFGVKGKWGGRILGAGAGMGACVLSDIVEDALDGDNAEAAPESESAAG
jgi:hypothetical protein